MANNENVEKVHFAVLRPRRVQEVEFATVVTTFVANKFTDRLNSDGGGYRLVKELQLDI